MSKTLTRKEWYADFVDYRRAYGYKVSSYNFIVCFLNWCDRTYPDNPYLTQEMLDEWRKRRPTENDESYGNRASYLNKLLVFINDRGGGSFSLHTRYTMVHRKEPAQITPEQIANFFRAVDEVTVGEEYTHSFSRALARLKAIEAPVIFRLLYSTGIRPNEARWLNREDVDLENGIIYLHRTKGYIERTIALHPSMTELLRKYYALITAEQPNAEPLFPTYDGEYHNQSWLNTKFKALWYKYNPKPGNGERDVVVYAFRHNYAIENIMNWHQDGYNADKRMVALSRSMGHVSIKSTQYYFHLVPRFADMLEDLEGDFVNKIMPEDSL